MKLNLKHTHKTKLLTPVKDVTVNQEEVSLSLKSHAGDTELK